MFWNNNDKIKKDVLRIFQIIYEENIPNRVRTVSELWKNNNTKHGRFAILLLDTHIELLLSSFLSTIDKLSENLKESPITNTSKYWEVVRLTLLENIDRRLASSLQMTESEIAQKIGLKNEVREVLRKQYDDKILKIKGSIQRKIQEKVSLLNLRKPFWREWIKNIWAEMSLVKKILSLTASTVFAIVLGIWLKPVFKDIFAVENKIFGIVAKACSYDFAEVKWETSEPSTSELYFKRNGEVKTCNIPRLTTEHKFGDIQGCTINRKSPASSWESKANTIMKVHIISKTAVGEIASAEKDVLFPATGGLCVKTTRKINGCYKNKVPSNCKKGFDFDKGLAVDSENSDIYMTVIENRYGIEKALVHAPHGIKHLSNTYLCDVENCNNTNFKDYIEIFSGGDLTNGRGRYLYSQKSTTFIVRTDEGRYVKLSLGNDFGGGCTAPFFCRRNKGKCSNYIGIASFEFSWFLGDNTCKFIN